MKIYINYLTIILGTVAIVIAASLVPSSLRHGLDGKFLAIGLIGLLLLQYGYCKVTGKPPIIFKRLIEGEK